MSTYLWLKQKGGGCDYTIGCGERLFRLEFGSDESDQAMQILEDIGVGIGDYSVKIEDALLLADVTDSNEKSVNVMEWVEEYMDLQYKEREEYERKEKLAQLKQLKAELGEE